jgi:hypothetical protein
MTDVDLKSAAEVPVNDTGAFLEALRREGKVSGRTFAGCIDLSGKKEGRVDICEVTFQHGFVADAAELTGLSFENCTFHKPLKLRNARVAGDVRLKRCTFVAAAARSPHEPRSLDLRGTIVHGSVEMSGVTAGGSCRFDRTVVRGRLKIHENCDVRGTTDFTGASVDSQLELSGSTFGEIVFSGSKLGSLWIGSRASVSCNGLYASDSEVRAFVRLSRLDVVIPEGEAARSRKRLHLEEPGTIAFRSCTFGSLFSTWIVKRFGEEEGGWKDDNRVVAQKAFLFTDCKVKGELTLSRLRVGTAEPGPALDPKGLPVVCEGAPGAKPWGHVRLDRTEVDGAFLILSPISVAHRFEMSSAARIAARKHMLPAVDPSLRAHMRSLSMRDFKASYVDLSGLSLHACGDDDDDRAIDGCLVGDRLEVKSSVTTYAWLKDECAPQPSAQSAPAETRRKGKKPATPARAARTANMRAYIEVPGAVRLRGGRIGELRLAAESFGTAKEKIAHRDGVVLELATIGQLRVPPRGTSFDCAHSNDFPVPLDLSGLTVRHWNFDEDVNAEGTGKVDDYLDFLDNDEKLHREVYRSVAQSLRDVGRDGDAEKVLYTEESRARWERDHPGGAWPPYPRAGRRGIHPPRFRTRIWNAVRHPIDWADRKLLGYRRNPIGLLNVILGLFVFSTLFISSRPANFELSNQARLVIENQREGMGDAAGIDARPNGARLEPARWGLWNALWMSTRYHVPIIPMLVEDEYVASNDDWIDFGLPLVAEPETPKAAGYDPGEVWLTAEDWFAVMSLLNWIMWPLLLTFALRRALRAEERASS